MTQDFLDFSKDRGERPLALAIFQRKEAMSEADPAGNDLVTRRGGFPGLKDGCRWCLCVER